MSIRNKFWFIFLGLAFIITGVFYGALRYIYLSSIIHLEEELAQSYIRQIQGLIRNEFRGLSQIVKDYGTWDDSYEFLSNGNRAFIETNLLDQTFENLNVSYISYRTHDGTVVFERNVLAPEQDKTTREQITQHLPKQMTDADQPVRTILYYQQTPLLITTTTVLKSDTTGPSKGTLSFGRALDPTEMTRYHELLGFPLELNRQDSPNKKIIHQEHNEDHSETILSVFDEQSIHGELILKTATNEPITFSFTRSREFYQSAILLLNKFSILIFLFSLVCVVIFMFILNQTILNRILRFITELQDISEKKLFTSTLPVQGTDELSVLATTVNQLLTTISNDTKTLEQKTIETQSQLKKIEDNNLNLEQTKTAMLNLLEDARALETQFQQEKDRAEAIVNSMGEALIVIDEHEQIQLLNPVAEHLLNIKKEDSIGKSWREFILLYQNDQAVANDIHPLGWVNAHKSTVIVGIDDNYTFQTPAGKRFPVAFSFSPLLSVDGRLIGIVNVFHDITKEKEEKNVIERTVSQRTQELKEKNEALERAQKEISENWLQGQKEKARLFSSLNSLPIGFILIDKDGSVFMANQATQTILGATEPITHIHVVAKHMQNSCDIEGLIQKSQEEKQITHQSDIVFETKYLSVTVVPIIIETNNEYIGTAVMIQDVTERKITDRARDEFFSIASHELRTPLTSIRGNTAMILQYFPELLKGNAELSEMLNDIHSSSVRLISIVNDFLNVSRLEMKKMSYKYSSVDIVQLSEKVNKELESVASEKKDTLTIVKNIDPIPLVYADPDRVKEVFLNLVGNAIKFTDQGSVTISLSVQDNAVRIEITDSGLGIPLEQQKLLFRKFQQAGENLYTRDTSKSSGLGLYISKLMIEEMKGTIGLARSEEKKGSTFFFTLPIAQ